MAEKDMEADMILAWLQKSQEVAVGWLTSPAAWSQFALLGLAFFAARLLTRRIGPPLERGIHGLAARLGPFGALIRPLKWFLPLLLPLLAYGLTAGGEQITRAAFGAGEVIAFGKRVFLFLAARILARDMIKDAFLKVLARYFLVPMAALYALGVLDEVREWMASTEVSLGNIQFSLLTTLRGAIVGSLLFGLGSWSNRQSSDFIKGQQELRPATRELFAKAAEVVIFGAAFLLLMSVMGIDLTAVAVLGGALGVGIGLGLQQIAAKYVSGVILLIEGQTTIGDYVELDGGEKGMIVKMTARACILETFDGKWIVVPNDHFITTRVVNYSDQGSANRYEATFSVSYETDINTVPELVERAVAALPFVMAEPDGPDVELVSFGEPSVDFAVEYWVIGIDDGKNKYRSHVMFAIWNALKEARIEMPYTRRVIEVKGAKLG